MAEPNRTLSERAECLLRALIEEYIRLGQPIGSKALAQSAGLELSSASIRNVLSDLEHMGFIRSPHTSSGRVPTIKGYRYFVDTLVTMKPVDTASANLLLSALSKTQVTHDMVTGASEFLSRMTSYAGVVTMPRRKTIDLKQIEFIPLSDNLILSILVTSELEIQNKLLRVNRRYSPTELEQASNYLNSKFSGKDIAEMRREITAEMEQDRVNVDQMMQTAIQMASRVFTEETTLPEADMVVAGQTKLMGHHDLASVDTLKQLFDAFSHKHDILHLLDQCLNTDGIQIYIGDESGYTVLGGCSLVTANYSVEGQVLGTVGVIGPTRMAYDSVISVVDITAKVLSSALNPK